MTYFLVFKGNFLKKSQFREAFPWKSNELAIFALKFTVQSGGILDLDRKVFKITYKIEFFSLFISNKRQFLSLVKEKTAKSTIFTFSKSSKEKQKGAKRDFWGFFSEKLLIKRNFKRFL